MGQSRGRSEPHVAPARVRGKERRESFTLLGHLGVVGPSDPRERLDPQGRPIPVELSRPARRAKPVDQDRAPADLGPSLQARRGDAAAIVVAELHVVVLGQEADGCRGVRIGERRAPDVEQLATSLVAERAQSRAEAFEHLAHPREPRPRTGVARRRRAERGEVPQHQLVRGGLGVERTAEPVLHGRERGPSRPAPDSARGYLHQRQEVHRRVRELGGVVVGPAFGQERDELGSGARALHEQPRGERLQLIHVQPVQRPPERALAVQRALHHGLEDRPERQGIPRRDEVERGPQQPHPHRPAFGDRLRQGLWPEAIQPRPQRHVGIARHLRLEADQAFDRVGHGDSAPSEQELALEQCAVERAAPEHARSGRCQLTCVPSLIQFVRQVTPSS